MKKRDLVLAGALLLGFGLKAQAQTAEETLFFFGFEDGLASFTDSSNPIDSITEIRYFDAPAGNGAGAGVMPTSFEVQYVKAGERNGNALQYSCLENSMDGGAWWAAVHGVTKSQSN